MNGPCCGCLDVRYDPIVNADGSRTDRWLCSHCGTTFHRAHHLNTLRWARDEACDALETWIYGHKGFSKAEREEALASVAQLRKVAP